MRTSCRFWALALWGVQLARAQAQPIPPGAPPVPPDTAEVERERSARPPAQVSPPSAAKPAGGAAATGGKPDAPVQAPAAPPARGHGVEPPPEPTPPPAPAWQAAPPAAQSDAGAAPGSSGAQPPAAGLPADPTTVREAEPPGAAHPQPSAAAGPAVNTGTQPAGSASSPPSAAQPAPALWSAAALLGLGVTFDDTAGSVNPLGFGFGLRGDYRIAEPWAVGARVLYFVGGSSGLPLGRVSMQTWLVAVEGAYVLRLDPLLVQPGLALGLHMRQIDERVLALPDMAGAAARSQNKTQVGLYLAPGVNIALPLGNLARELDYLIAGMDVRLDLAFGSRVTSNIQLLLMAGLRF